MASVLEGGMGVGGGTHASHEETRGTQKGDVFMETSHARNREKQ